jgi:hypothetical protein
MSPAWRARRTRSRQTLAGIAVEMAYVLGLSSICCLICTLAYFLAG